VCSKTLHPYDLKSRSPQAFEATSPFARSAGLLLPAS